ncbi:histone-lysine N-methyltransferase, H3 lysine-79 specific [Eurytemora carolleeae]|uniref:histone-lysine N-methyltransferase, H3 lysine-79 specific n=1 Tax=Eurytemora carolleeae TaxID=1294199 RepID=UPI000C77F00E|nr:histone-lysine N-methyltransferase, H3 lysine-79 specific [Eurytemora carolleeae]|eukprot:XP_023336254.1 histone-lysine N-methyltransferase, H3 lysine-79 specific-like [Eurytemora affinis]
MISYNEYGETATTVGAGKPEQILVELEKKEKTGGFDKFDETPRRLSYSTESRNQKQSRPKSSKERSKSETDSPLTGGKRKKKKKRRKRSKSLNTDTQEKKAIVEDDESEESNREEFVEPATSVCPMCLMNAQDCAHNALGRLLSREQEQNDITVDEPDEEGIVNPVEGEQINETKQRRKSKKKEEPERKRRKKKRESIRKKSSELSPKFNSPGVKKKKKKQKEKTLISKKKNDLTKSVKDIPLPIRDLSKYQTSPSHYSGSQLSADEVEEEFDEYFVVEADLSTFGGYFYFSSVSVPVDLRQPEIIQRRSSNTPALPKKAADEDDEKNKLEEDLEELRMDNLVLQNQILEQERELENLGCFRCLFQRSSNEITPLNTEKNKFNYLSEKNMNNNKK